MTFIILIGRQNHRVKKGLCMSFLCLNSGKMNNQTIYVKMSPENLSVCEEPVILRIIWMGTLMLRFSAQAQGSRPGGP